MPAVETKKRISDWLEYLDRAYHRNNYKPICDLFAGMAKIYRKQHILFGDVHSGNVGVVDGKWVIIDPGNIAVVPEQYR